jgi:chromosome segregation ATPase
MAISKEQVFKAADELQAAGQKPTLEAIRKKVGGSYTTLAPLLREWKAAQASADAPLQEPVPSSIAARMEDVAAEVWRAALDLANSRLQEEREALEEKRKELESERDEAVALADGLAADLDAARAQVEQLTAELVGLRERAQSDALQIARLQGALQAVEPLIAELKRAAAPVQGEQRAQAQFDIDEGLL